MVKIYIDYDLHNFRALFGSEPLTKDELIGLHTDESYTPDYTSRLVTKEFIEEKLPIKLLEDIVVIISYASPIFMMEFDILMMKCSFNGYVKHGSNQIMLEVRYKTIEGALKLSCSIDGDESLYDSFKIPYRDYRSYHGNPEWDNEYEEESNGELDIFRTELAKAINKYFSRKSLIKSARSFPISLIEN